MSPQRILVAGATGPIGAAISHTLAGGGASLALQYRSRRTSAEDLLANLDGTGHVVLAADLLDPDTAPELIARAEGSLGGPLTALVNCAWPSHTSTRLAEASPQAIEESLDGMRAHLNLCRAAMPGLRATAGAVVFLGAGLVHRRHPGLGLYALGKAAAENASLTMALEEGPHGVRVNVIAPGRVDIGLGDLVEADPDFASLDVIGAQRRVLPLPTPRQIADLVAYLVGPEATAVTGQVISVSGGEQW